MCSAATNRHPNDEECNHAYPAKEERLRGGNEFQSVGTEDPTVLRGGFGLTAPFLSRF